MSWKDKFSFLSEPSDYVDVEIKGQELRFYTLSVQALFNLRALAEPVSRLLAALFRDSSKDVTQEQISQGERVETRIQAIDPELAKQIDQERKKALEGLLELMTNQDTASSIGLLLFDSLRDLRPEKYGRKEALEFVRELDLPTLVEMLKGLLEANKGLLAPLAKALQAAPGTEDVQEAVGKTLDDSQAS